MITSPSIANISAALVKAQAAMGSAVKDSKNPFFKSKYADLGSVVEVCKQPLNDNGISVVQPCSTDDKGHYVQTILIHSCGEIIGTEKLYLELPKKDMQALGSAITYARRYQLQSLLNIPTTDDDAEASMPRKTEPEPVVSNNVSNITTETKPLPSFNAHRNKQEGKLF